MGGGGEELRLTKIMEWLRKVGGWESARDIFAENLYSAQHSTPLAENI
jgi:hypothetical protein